MRQNDAFIGQIVKVEQPHGWHSATMSPYNGHKLTIERFGPGPVWNEKVAYCKETGEIPFNLSWLKAVPVASYTGRFSANLEPPEPHFLPPPKGSLGDKIRKMLCPEGQRLAKNLVFIDADFSQIESRIAAMYYKSEFDPAKKFEEFSKDIVAKHPGKVQSMEYPQPESKKVDDCDCPSLQLLIGHICKKFGRKS